MVHLPNFLDNHLVCIMLTIVSSRNDRLELCRVAGVVGLSVQGHSRGTDVLYVLTLNVNIFLNLGLYDTIKT